jgi:3-hydroxyisobutyrate dehydrogenase
VDGARRSAGRLTVRIGFIGLGAMGRPMATRLASAGFELSIFDTSPVALAAFAAAAARDAAEVGSRADIVVTMLPTGADVARAVLGGRGVLAGLAPGGLIVDMSSSAPHETRALGTAVAAAGRRLVDAPVSGGVVRAGDGSLTIIAGGEAADVAECGPLFEALGTRTLHVGPLGAGHAAKALNNAVSAAGLVAALEALIAARAAGIEPAAMLAVLNASTGRNNATENKIAQQVLSGTYASGFALGLMAKDVAIAAELERLHGIQSALLDRVDRVVGEAAAALGERADHTEIARWLDELACGESAAPGRPDADGASAGEP